MIKLTKKQEKLLYRLLNGVMVYVLVIVVLRLDVTVLKRNEWLVFSLYLLAYLIIGYDVVWKAVKNIGKRQIFDENFLMTIATMGAFGLQEYQEAVAVMLFYQIGELFQSYAVNRSRQSIAALMDIRPEYANVEVDGILKKVDPEDLKPGDFIVVKPGERIPLDGIVVSGSSFLDTSALTGESVPRKVKVGDNALSGCINQNGLIKLQVTKEYDDSTVAKILELVENASSKKAQTENFITRFARYYTPVVCLMAAFMALVVPAIVHQPYSEWVPRALVFLVISCPCALVISVPLSFFGGIGGASKLGVLIKGSNYMEVLANTDLIVFDKTGTLTKGTFEVERIYSSKPGPDAKQQILKIAAHLETNSNHPIAVSIRKAYHGSLKELMLDEIQELSGYGITALLNGKRLLLGNEKLMHRYGIKIPLLEITGTVVYLAAENHYMGCIVIADEIKENTVNAVRELKKLGISKTIMLTGDLKAQAEKIARKVGIDEVHADLLPTDKLNILESILAKQDNKHAVAYIGDGINDAPVLTRADVGIAMGGAGSDAAIEAADIVLMSDDPLQIYSAIKVSKRTLRIVKQNIIFAIGVKAIVLVLGAFGLANMWLAVFADVGVSVIAILNAMRALMVKKVNVMTK